MWPWQALYLQMSQRPARACNLPAPWHALPSAPEYREYFGEAHAGGRLVECIWKPEQGLDASLFLAPWLNLAERRRLRNGTLEVILTVEEANGRWQPTTIVMASHAVPGELGLYAARALTGGELISAMQDGVPLTGPKPTRAVADAAVSAAGGAAARYLYEYRGRIMDGATCRDGGARRANDPTGTGSSANAGLYTTGCLCVLPHCDVPSLRAGQTHTQQRACEILHCYGPGWWRVHAP